MTTGENIEIELLSGMIQSQNCLLLGVRELKPQYFKSDTNRYVFEIICKLFKNGIQPDITAIVSENKRWLKYENEFAYYVASITDSIVLSTNFSNHIVLLKERFINEECRLKSLEISSIAESKDFETLLQKVSEIYDFVNTELAGSSESLHFADVANKCYKQLIERKKAYKEGLTIGITSGLNTIDKQTGGFRAGELIIVAARPGMGKTALALHIAKKAAEAKKGVYYFSLEMSDISLGDRLLLAESGVSSQGYKNGSIEDYDVDKIVVAGKELSKNMLYIDDKAKVNIPYIKAAATMKRNRGECDMIIIDYLQLMDINRKGINREQAVSETTRELKILAKELNIPIILLSQLNREAEDSKTHIPKLEHLRESGAIEQDADTVLMLTRPAYYSMDIEALRKNIKSKVLYEVQSTEGLLLINIAKQRSGSTGIVFCSHNEPINNFYDIQN